MRFLQDKSIDNVLRYLHRECMNGRHEGLEHVLALMRLRGVEPHFRALAPKYRIAAGATAREDAS